VVGDYHFRNLVFEGGGVKGVAYVGVLRELRKREILRNIDRIGGASAGAINAVLLATGHGQRETTELLLDLNFKNFLDDDWGIARDTRRLMRNYGWYKGDFFRDWMGKRIKAKTGDADATFADLQTLRMKDLYLIVTNLSTGFSEVKSAEHTPDMPVADAVRMSMSIPLFFASKRNRRKDVFVDGGVLNNYPIKVFDREQYIDPEILKQHGLNTDYYQRDNARTASKSSPYCYNKETLGFRLDTKEEIALFRDGVQPQARKIEHFFDYGWALFQALMNVQNSAHLHSDDWQRTIYVDTLGVGTTDFELSDTKKKKLIRSGADAVINYFDWYDKTRGKTLPNNHPRFKLKN